MLDCLLKQNKNNEYNILIEEFLKKFPNDEILNLNSTHIDIQSGKLEQAVKKCDFIISLNPLSSLAYYNKACALSVQFKNTEALSALKKVYN